MMSGHSVSSNLPKCMCVLWPYVFLRQNRSWYLGGVWASKNLLTVLMACELGPMGQTLCYGYKRTEDEGMEYD